MGVRERESTLAVGVSDLYLLLADAKLALNLNLCIRET